MKQLFPILFVLLSNILSGQEIPYSLEILDGITTPVNSHSLRSFHEGSGGVYLNHNQWTGGDDYIISFFDGEQHSELFRSENQLSIVGSTAQGAFIIETVQSGPFARHLLFVNQQGFADTLSDAPLHLPDTYQFGEILYTFSTSTGIRSFTEDGTETLLSNQFSNCNCFDDFYEFDDRLVFKAGDEVHITNGTPEGTRVLFDNSGELLEYNGLLFVYDRRSLHAYDPESDEVTDVSNDLPNITEPFFDLEGATATDNGVVFISSLLNTTGRELFITDGTKEGTRLLTEINPGPEDGITWQGRPNTISVGKNLIFRRGPGEDSQEIWTTDGSVEGTYKLLDLTDEELLQSGEFQGTVLADGQFLFTIHYGNAISYDSYIFSVNPENPGVPAVAVDTIPFNLRSSARGLLNNRWLFNPGTTLISYGTDYKDVDTIGATRSFSEELKRFPDLLFYLFSDGSSGPDTLSVTRGSATGLLPILLTSNSSASNPEIFTIRDSIYAYVFTAGEGESIYRINPENFSTRLVIDLYENNAGQDIREFEPVGNKIFYQKDFFSSPTRFQLFSDDPYTISQVIPDDFIITPGAGVVIGNIGPKFFFRESSTSNKLSELDIETGIFRNLDTLIPSDPFRFSRPVILNDRIYVFGNEFLETPARRVDLLLEVNPADNSNTIILADTTSENIGEQNRSIVTDGQLLYFAFRQDEEIRPVSYDPVTGTVVAVAPPRADTQFSFFAIDGQVSVAYSHFPEQSEVYWISPTGIGAQLPFGSYFSNYESIALAEKILLHRHFETNSFFSLDRITGDTIQLAKGDGARVVLPTAISEQEAIFFRKDNNSDVWSLWRTDGTREGSRKIVDFPAEIDAPPVSTATFGYHVGIMTNSPDSLYLFDPVSEVLESIPVEPNFGTETVVAINGSLYFVGVDPTLGEEIHKIEITDQETVSGLVFQDDNGNGVKEEGEPGIGNARITIDGGNIRSIFSNDEGLFSLPVKDGNAYALTIDQPRCFQELSTPGQYSIHYSQDSTYQLNFGYSSAAGDGQLSVLLNSDPIRCGFEVNFYLTVINDGCAPLAGEVSLTLGEEITFLEASQEPERQTGQTLLFEYDTLAPAAAHQIRLTLRMPDENFVGLPVEMTAMASGTAAGGTISTAEDFHYAEVLRCAIDPNDKQVSPSRPEPSNSNYTQIDEALRYTIRFQNTGNDTAFTVRIMDKIAPDLDLSTFKPLTASHPFTASLRDDRTAIFLFEDILLPDSITNLTLSQGFVTFEIFPMPGLTDFSVVENTAGIFFDFNQPVITNTVASTIVEFLDEDMDGFYFYEECDDTNRDINPDAVEIPNNGIDENCDNSDFPVSTINALSGALHIYPNPSRGEVRLEYSEATNMSVSVTNVTGSQLINKQFSNSVSLDLRNAPPGVYFVTVMQVGTGERSVQRIIIQ